MLNEKGIPTPLVHTMLCPPRSRMDVLTEREIDNIVSRSKLATKYNESIDSESAYEMLTAKLEQASQQSGQEKQGTQKQKVSGRTAQREDSIFDTPVMRQVERTAASVLTRSLLGVLVLGGRRKSLF